jgi:DNA-binding CsgD family transcriptional regulator
LALGELGHYESALRTLLAGVALAETLGERYYLAKLLNTVGWLYHELGDAETAREWDLRALEAVRGTHADRVTEAERYTLLNLTSDELAAGRVDAAAEHVRAIEPLLARREYGLARYCNRYQLLLAEVALAQGDAAAALRAAQEVPHLASPHDMPKNVAKRELLTGRAHLAQGRPAAAFEALECGVALADSIGHASLRWQGRLWLGDALRALRRDAAAVYDEAMAQVTALANGLDDDRLRETFLASPRVRELRERAAQLKAAPRAEERPAGLTARELEVLRLLAQHRTDKEIAAELYLSSRTIESHVANILTKLGVANRRAAATAAGDLGLA